MATILKGVEEDMARTRSAEEVSAPMVGMDAGRLLFTRGASHLTIRVDASSDDLYRARFEGKLPHVWVDGGTVTVKYRPSLRPTHGEITLSGGVPWAIKASMGMSEVVADLEEVELTGLEVSAGASGLEVKLPRPKAAVRIRIGGGARDVQLIRPAGVPVRVRIGGGASKLAIDDFRVGAAGGKTDWRSPEYDRVEGRYDIEIGAGASKLTVSNRTPSPPVRGEPTRPPNTTSADVGSPEEGCAVAIDEPTGDDLLRERAIKLLKKRRDFFGPLLVYTLVNAFLVVIWP